MASKEEVINVARSYLRDFPKYFQLSFSPAGRTYDLGRPNVAKDDVWVAYIPQGGTSASAGASVSVLPDEAYVIDERNGLLRINSMPPADTIMVEGYHYEWLVPSDLDFYADLAMNYHTHNIDIPFENFAPVVVDVIGIYTLVQALWGLVSEFSRDIDVIASESVHIVASQRYRMVSSLLDYWMAEYNKRAQALNIGLERIEVVTLRRVSRTTNRLVPVYRPREVGDHGPMERLFPPIDPGVISPAERPEKLRQDVTIDGDPPDGYINNAFY
jgi:hypothetical protein